MVSIQVSEQRIKFTVGFGEIFIRLFRFRNTFDRRSCRYNSIFKSFGNAVTGTFSCRTLFHSDFNRNTLVFRSCQQIFQNSILVSIRCQIIGDFAAADNTAGLNAFAFGGGNDIEKELFQSAARVVDTE